MFVSVVDFDQNPLMPTTPARARRWVESGKATPFFKQGVYCVRLNQEPSDRITQPIAVGIDPGSKKEGFTVKSASHTYLNIQADAVAHVKDAMKDRSQMRRTRRQRNTPCCPPRYNRSRPKNFIPPSTRARWGWKLRIVNWLKKLFPITDIVVEDIKAKTTGKKKWDQSFSPLEVGKNWFYDELSKTTNLFTLQGYETKQWRDSLGLKKTSRKMDEVFEAHCVDSWVLAHSLTGGSDIPDNTRLLCVTPLKFHRRELHRRNPVKGGFRGPYGGTRSLGFKRGSIVKSLRWGLTYIGGTSKGMLSLHFIETGERLCKNAKPSEIKFLSYSSWRSRLV